MLGGQENRAATSLSLGSQTLIRIAIRTTVPTEALMMKTYQAVVEKCSETSLYIGRVPGFPGAHS